jgi:hypothetical protein
MASASRPSSAGKIDIETADDFLLTNATILSSASFYGLTPSGSAVQNAFVEIYRVFPLDSDVGRTSGAPLFSTPQVPTRVNSPSDVAFASGGESFSTAVFASSFTANNSVLNGIHPLPNIHTGGDGAATGQEVQFTIDFGPGGLALPAGHYFFVPQVELDSGDFLWLSASRPNIDTPFAPDLQSWIRNGDLDPDWLRIGADIVGGTAFNAAFSLTGDMHGTDAVPEPESTLLFAGALAGFGFLRRRRATRSR